MNEARKERVDDSPLSLVSQGGDRQSRRGRRLLPAIVYGFLFCALCLLLTDFRRLDLFAGKHEVAQPHTVHHAQPFKLAVKRQSPRG